MWLQPDGNGFSETCSDLNFNDICDSSYSPPNGASTDYLPLQWIGYVEAPEPQTNTTEKAKSIFPLQGMISQILTLLLLFGYFIFN